MIQQTTDAHQAFNLGGGVNTIAISGKVAQLTQIDLRNVTSSLQLTEEINSQF